MTENIHNNNNLRAVIYLRVASQEQADQRSALASQRDACQREAKQLGAVVTDEFADAGVSGNTTDRDGLQCLLTHIAEQSVTYVVVRDWARLARNQATAATIALALKQAGVSLESASDRCGGGL